MEEVQTGALVNDGGRLVSLQSQTLSVRRQMLYNGSASVTLVIDKKGVLKADPIVSFTGVTDGDDLEDLVLDAADAVRDLLDDMSARDRTKDDVVREATRRMIRKLIRSDYDKRPLTDVHLVRLQ